MLDRCDTDPARTEAQRSPPAVLQRRGRDRPADRAAFSGVTPFRASRDYPPEPHLACSARVKGSKFLSPRAVGQLGKLRLQIRRQACRAWVRGHKWSEGDVYARSSAARARLRSDSSLAATRRSTATAS